MQTASQFLGFFITSSLGNRNLHWLLSQLFREPLRSLYKGNPPFGLLNKTPAAVVGSVKLPGSLGSAWPYPALCN